MNIWILISTFFTEFVFEPLSSQIYGIIWIHTSPRLHVCWSRVFALKGSHYCFLNLCQQSYPVLAFFNYLYGWRYYFVICCFSLVFSKCLLTSLLASIFIARLKIWFLHLEVDLECFYILFIRCTFFSLSNQVKMAVQYMRRVIERRAKFDIMDLNCLQVLLHFWTLLCWNFWDSLTKYFSLACYWVFSMH